MKNPFIKIKFREARGLQEALQLISDDILTLNDNLETIYDLLPEKQEVKKIKPLRVYLNICETCRKKDIQSNMYCGCYCHNPTFTVGQSPTGTSFIASPAVMSSIKS